MTRPLDETRDLKSEIRVLKAQIAELESRKNLIVTEPIVGNSQRHEVSWVHQICLNDGTTISLHRPYSSLYWARAIAEKGYYENGFAISPSEVDSVKVFWLNLPETEYVGVERK